jgi:UPF0176 protein
MLIVAALYKFTRFDDPEGLRPACEAFARRRGEGHAPDRAEGINGTIAGTRAGIDAVLAHVRGLPGLRTWSGRRAPPPRCPSAG